MTSGIFAETQRLLLESAETLPHRFTPTGELARDLGTCWEEIVTPVDVALTQSGDQNAIRLIGSIEDGMHVVLHGMGQILQQSLAREEDPFDPLHERRVVASYNIFQIISRLPNEPAAQLEDTLGFRSFSFHHPKELLRMNGTSVEIPAHLIPSETPKSGCPFRQAMAEIYPELSEKIIKRIIPVGSTV